MGSGTGQLSLFLQAETFRNIISAIGCHSLLPEYLLFEAADILLMWQCKFDELAAYILKKNQVYGLV